MAAMHLRTLLTVGAVGHRTDAELLARFVAGDDAAELAFAALVDRHGTTVLRVARTILGDEATSLDASQATFLILAQKARSLRVGDSLAPWLAAVARRVALGARKTRARRQRLEQAAARPEAIADPANDGRGEALRAVLAEVDRLPEPYRAAVVACHLDGLTQHQAAGRLGWPVGTLQSRLDRGRRKLRDRLTRRGLTPTSLGLIPPAGLGLSFPAHLVPPLAQTAAAGAIGFATPPLIAPGVREILQATSHGATMTKLAVASLTLITAVGLAATGQALGVGAGAGTGAAGPRVVALNQQATEPPGSGKADAGGRIASDPPAIEGVIVGDPAPDPEPKPPGRRTRIVTEEVTTPGQGVVKQSRIVVEAEPGAPDPGLPTQPPAQPTPDADAIRPPEGVPTLLWFTVSWGTPDLMMAPQVAKLIENGYPVRTIALDKNPNYLKTYRYTAIPAFVVVNGSGEVLGQLAGAVSARDLADLYNRSLPRSAALNPSTAEPTLSLDGEVPRPWQTAARLAIEREDKDLGPGQGSGTIVASRGKEAFVLTSAHIFFGRGGRPPDPKHFRGRVFVDLFDGVLKGLDPARVTATSVGLEGELLDLDVAYDLALVRIHPPGEVRAAPVAAANSEPSVGTRLYSVGCSNGLDASTWNTTVVQTSSLVANAKTKVPFEMLECTLAPKTGRSGGGLFTTSGYLVGVCNFGNPIEDAGLYTKAKGIHELLKRNGFREVDGRRGAYAKAEAAEEAARRFVAGARPSPAVPNDGDGLPVARGSEEGPAAQAPQLVLVPGLSGEVPGLAGYTFVPQPFVSQPAQVPALAAPPDRSPQVPSPEIGATAPPAVPTPSSPPAAATPPVSPQDRRLDDLEQKLDRLIQSLDTMRGERKPDRPASAPPAP